jgi:toxin ParE1/3/4
MGRFELAPLAEADLAAVTDYTREQWGVNQAEGYLDEVWTLLTKLAELPLMGRARDDLDEELRSFPFRSHVIYFKLAESGALIVRVLHKSQDPTRHL